MALKLKSMRAAVSAAALMIAITGPAAHAAPLLFTVTGGSSGSWLQDSDPTPTYSDAYQTLVSVTGATGDYFGSDSIRFYSSIIDGGYGGYIGPQIYSNTTANPHFSIGTFNLAGASMNVSAAPSGPAAPAPLAGAGLLSALAALTALAMTRLFGRKGQLA